MLTKNKAILKNKKICIHFAVLFRDMTFRFTDVRWGKICPVSEQNVCNHQGALSLLSEKTLH